MERHYTPEHLERLDARAAELGEAAIREVEDEWPRLIARVREAMEAGVDPASEEVRALARSWSELVEMFTGGDPEIRQGLARAYREEEGTARAVGLDRELLEYVSRAQPS
ncbi:MAG: albicidin resistance protein [Gemmatimonadetes bacterium]|nr:albicidin resistance protein [Gemmatimonadota bacterium]NIR79507.1 albicidin resistance protein [Gemmatimonadota bacterium]NIT88184.1 albicidin resistance protein [Gemmatimonadota bacterium]NIU31991.1 albicidin resistance protein [Gemmatimonadota bacterium]NIU36603.1 albicidin resistance protein [Gemmatimonadota bacterium]